LRYRLLPELKEMNPGNPIQNYMRCMLEQEAFFFDKEEFERRDKLLAMPIKELAAPQFQEYGRHALDQADRAARLDCPDWQILLKLRTDGFYTLLPEVQQLRSLARALQVRFRAEVARGAFDDAIRTAKTMFAMARHLGDHPTYIGNLVGIAIAAVTIAPLEEMLEQPGCPNLYWALTTLPQPLVRADKGAEGEQMSLVWVFRDLDDTAPMSADRIKKFCGEIDKALNDEKPKKPGEDLASWLAARAKDQAVVSAARRRLTESGLKAELVARLPAEQAILLDEKRECAVRFDDVTKTMILPIWQMEAMAARHPKPEKSPAKFADALLPSTAAVRLAHGRIEQRLALLRTVEALRMHAAEHKGTFPANLAEVVVPLPDDPVTGKPFRYDRKDGVAHLRGSPPAGRENDVFFNIHYELVLQN
jgi:hypothetical protein